MGTSLESALSGTSKREKGVTLLRIIRLEMLSQMLSRAFRVLALTAMMFGMVHSMNYGMPRDQFQQQLRDRVAGMNPLNHVEDNNKVWREAHFTPVVVVLPAAGPVAPMPVNPVGEGADGGDGKTGLKVVLVL